MKKQQNVSGCHFRTGIYLNAFSTRSIEDDQLVLFLEPGTRAIRAARVHHNNFVNPRLGLKTGDRSRQPFALVQDRQDYGNPGSVGARCPAKQKFECFLGRRSLNFPRGNLLA